MSNEHAVGYITAGWNFDFICEINAANKRKFSILTCSILKHIPRK